MKRIIAAAATLLLASLFCSAQNNGNGEIVDIGYGKTTKEAQTNAVSDNKVKSNEASSYSNIIDYLRGRVPGLSIGPSNGSGMPSIQIRGISSINSGTQPLILVDGVEMANIMTLSPQDIYEVSILKDASASIYGFRGANGVILITTQTARTIQMREEAEQKARKEAEKQARKEAKQNKKNK